MKRENMLIEADELLKKLGNENIRIFDAAINDDQYIRGHIPGAVYFDHEKFSDPHGKYAYTMLPQVELATQIGDIGISNDTEVVFYSWGMLPYAARAWWILHYAGHTKVRVFNGGLAAWQNAGGQLEQEIRHYEPSTFKAQFRPDMFASKEDVMDALKNSDISVVNVLPPISYEGAHITGSANLSCMDLMHDMDSFLSNDRLASLLHETSQYKRIITYCGGGIAAALNAMVHVMVGQEYVAVYDGSMYEWIGEELPITGSGKWEFWKMNA
jgi:thiosulfate/3-mercaptopyruvate sulfurtransferase